MNTFESNLEKIREIISSRGQIKVKNLAAELGMSIVNLRRYLKVLEERGLIYKTYGYVHAREEGALLELPYIFRRRVNLDLKIKVARRALELIKEDDSLFLDVGTSILCLTEMLPPDKQLTVITNWIPHLTVLNEKPAIQAFILGGKVRKLEMSVDCVDYERDIVQFNIDKAFFGVSAISVEEGFVSDFDDGEIRVKRKILQIAKKKILLADSSKVHKSAPIRICGVEAFDVIVIDDNVEEEIVKALTNRGIKVLLA